MKRILHHINEVKKKPHHVRKRVTFVYAGALTALIAVVWLAGSLSTGTFALKPTSFADAGASTVEVTGDTGSTGLAGAAAAPAASPKSGPARIEIVDVATSSGKQAEPTTIPF